METSGLLFLLAAFLALLSSSISSAAIVEHSFHVKNLTVSRLCRQQVITAVNDSIPGPTIRVRENDTLVIYVFNFSPYNLTIHWHGVFQLLSGWADGPDYATQCPIKPGQSYTYRFRIIRQEGTLWWHAHVSWLRAWVYGALIIRPRTHSHSYLFPKPHREIPLLLGEWWNANVIDVENQGLATGGAPNNSDAYTINGLPGDLYPCSSNQMYKLSVIAGETYLLRIINAALNNQLFFKIANHKMTVIGIDATYTVPYVTDVVVTAPGQTVDVLLTADQSPGTYYMAAHAYSSAPGLPFNNSTTRGIVVYNGANRTAAPPLMPILPAFNDTPTAHKFYSNLTSHPKRPFSKPVPATIDEHMFVTSGLGLISCNKNITCAGPMGQILAASMNNESFRLPTRLSMLEAYFYNVNGIYTTDFPNQPAPTFDYVNSTGSLNQSLIMTKKSTKVKQVKFNSTIEIVIQNTAFVAIENHPIHLHGFNFFVVGQGFGNYDPLNHPKTFNLFNPQERNTIAVPVGGWAVIRFRANNPGVWLMHCHLDVHLPWGLATAIVVESGGTPSSTLPPPPADLPKC